MRDDLRTLLPRLLRDERCVVEYRNAIASAYDQLDDSAEAAYNMADFSNMELCSSLALKSSSHTDSTVYVARPDGGEAIWSVVGVVKAANFPPVPWREYSSPGTLYSAVAVVAPVDSEYHRRVVEGLTNVYRLVATASSQRVFRPFELRSMDGASASTTGGLENKHVELFFKSRTFHRRKDIKDGKMGGRIIEVPPVDVDSNGTITKLLQQHKKLCFTDDNIVGIFDDSSRSNERVATSGDSVVPGQLVMVSFCLRAVYEPSKNKNVKSKRHTHGRTRAPGGGMPTWCLQPTVRSVTILSKLGPLILDEMRTADRRAESEADAATSSRQAMFADLRRVNPSEAVARAVKRIRRTAFNNEDGGIEDLAI